MTVPTPSRDLIAGTEPASDRRLGAYRLESLLGRGGMGEVWSAWDERLQRRVAIKRIHPDLRFDDERRRRFRREARALAQLSHPGVVQIYELLTLRGEQVVQWEDGTEDALVMELVDGASLDQLMIPQDHGLEPGRALQLGIDIAEALSAAHRVGVVHRDLKAENVLVTRDGRAKVVDFGLARRLWTQGEEAEGRAAPTAPGTLVGTVHAMSPEQASGREIDHRSDLFALGSLLYELLAGRPPFRGEHWLDTLRRVTSEEPPSLGDLHPGLPEELLTLLGQLLAKEPEDRPANAQIVAAQLRSLRARPELSGGRAPELAFTPGKAPRREEVTGEWPVPNQGAESGGREGFRAAVRALLRVEIHGADGVELPRELSPRVERERRRLVEHFEGKSWQGAAATVAVFPRSAQAVACAHALQQTLKSSEVAEEEGPSLGMAIHLGEVWIRRGTSGGSTKAMPQQIDEAALELLQQLSGLAREGRILLTRGAFDLARRSVSELVESLGSEAPAGAEGVSDPGAEERAAFHWLAHGSYRVEGGEELLAVFEVVPPGAVAREAPDNVPGARRLLSAQDERMLGWRPAQGQRVPQREHWTLVERLGGGGFGEVWLARHRGGDLRVFKFCHEADRLHALKREVTLFQLLRDALGHREDIARILDWQFDSAPYFVESEYTAGGSLVHWAEEQGGLSSIPLERRLALVADVATALAAAHSVGILHKDIKPDNVLVTLDREGRARSRLTDFGIGLLTERRRLQATVIGNLGFTATASPNSEERAGTAGYMAPELLRGETDSVQADIYSLGVLLYQMVAGDFSKSLAPGWERDVQDSLLAEDIAVYVDGDPRRRPDSAREVAHRLLHLEARRQRRREETERREALQRAQRRKRLASTVAVVAVVMAAVVSWMAWRENQARRVAEEAQARASLRQEQAENLIDFMIHDLQDKLNELGRLELLRDATDEAMEYFAAVPEGELSSLEISRRSMALIQIGELRLAEGLIDEAIDAFRESRALMERLVNREPNTVEWLSKLGVSHFWVGAAHWRLGATENARQSFEAQEEMQRRALEIDPENLELKKQYAYSISNLGHVRRGEGDLEGALRAFRSGLDLKRELTPSPPEQQDLQLDLFQQLSVVGVTQMESGLLTTAEESFREALALADLMQASNPENVQWQKHRATLHTHFGRLLDATRQEDQLARDHFDSSLRIWRKLTALEPGNLEWRAQLSAIENRRGVHAMRRGRLDEARGYLLRSRQLSRELVEVQSRDAAWRAQLASSSVYLARLEVLAGRLAAAEKSLREAQSLLEGLLTEVPDNRTYRFLSALGSENEALLAQARGDENAAADAWRSALDTLRPVAEGSNDFELLVPWMRILHELGHEEDLRSARRRLRQAGYRSDGLLI
ncbi:MAG: protein kinase [Acidobacteriota bacterium]